METFRGKKVLVLIALLTLFSIVALVGIYYIKKYRPVQKDFWGTYDKRVDYVTKAGVLIRDENRKGGITILPLNYQEKSSPYSVISYSFVDKVEKTHLIFDSLSEFTKVKLLPNSIDSSKLWVVTFRADSCSEESLNPKGNTSPRGDCKFKIYEYDLNTDKLSEKKELRFWVGTSVRDVYLLTHDNVNNNVWIGVDYQVPQGQVSQWETQLSEPIDLNRQHFGTDLIKYNANTNESSIIQTPYWMSSRFNPLHKTLAKTGNGGELYFIGECDIKCGDKKYLNDGVAVTQINSTSQVPIFYYGQDLGPIRYFQITTDSQNNFVYTVTKSFDQSKPSSIFRYDITTGRSLHIGRQPTQVDDDVRGLDVVDGRLAIGSFNGLAVYNSGLDKWNFVKQNSGIKSNNVEGVYAIDGGGVCLIHENDGASCLFEPLSKYLDNLK